MPRTYAIEKSGQWYALRWHDPEGWPNDGMILRAHTKAPMVILKAAIERGSITRDEFNKYVEADAKSMMRSTNMNLAAARVSSAEFAVGRLRDLGIRPPASIREDIGRILVGVQKPVAKVTIRYGRVCKS